VRGDGTISSSPLEKVWFVERRAGDGEGIFAVSKTSYAPEVCSFRPGVFFQEVLPRGHLESLTRGNAIQITRLAGKHSDRFALVGQISSFLLLAPPRLLSSSSSKHETHVGMTGSRSFRRPRREREDDAGGGRRGERRGTTQKMLSTDDDHDDDDDDSRQLSSFCGISAHVKRGAFLPLTFR